MAGEQGTGKHPHKSAAEPYEHHEAATSKKAETDTHKVEPHKAESHKAEPHKAAAHETESKGEQGTGKHPHKSAADPKEHHEATSKK